MFTTFAFAQTIRIFSTENKHTANDVKFEDVNNFLSLKCR